MGLQKMRDFKKPKLKGKPRHQNAVPYSREKNQKSAILKDIDYVQCRNFERGQW